MIRCKYYWIILIYIGLCSSHFANGQKKPNDPEAYFPTENVSPKFKDDNTRENIPREKPYAVIYKNSAKGTLYGNQCATEATKKMGFIYVIQPIAVPNSVPFPFSFFNNVWVNTKLVFTRSPFWKVILKKRIDECRKNTGDIVG